MVVIVDASKCTGCEACVNECLLSAISIVNGKANVNKDNCFCPMDDGETPCSGVCPVEAIYLAQDR